VSDYIFSSLYTYIITYQQNGDVSPEKKKAQVFCYVTPCPKKFIAFNFWVRQFYKVHCSINVDPEEGPTNLRNVATCLPIDT
jgi:hypothetical protein